MRDARVRKNTYGVDYCQQISRRWNLKFIPSMNIFVMSHFDFTIVSPNLYILIIYAYIHMKYITLM